MNHPSVRNLSTRIFTSRRGMRKLGDVEGLSLNFLALKMEKVPQSEARNNPEKGRKQINPQKPQEGHSPANTLSLAE